MRQRGREGGGKGVGEKSHGSKDEGGGGPHDRSQAPPPLPLSLSPTTHVKSQGLIVTGGHAMGGVSDHCIIMNNCSLSVGPHR